jgi:uncharacterized repeat protein (TIGR03837 family)
MNLPSKSCAIFCRVIDNYGDAAVCWRLAAQLAADFSWNVQLIIDNPERLHQLSPTSPDVGVSVTRWSDDISVDVLPDLVIEAFACELPPKLIAAMASRAVAPVWINLDYLSAEAWVEDCHLLPSPQSTHRLTKYFFFPGFTPRTGGILREADYSLRRTRFHPMNFRSEFGIPSQSQELLISLFCYDNAPAASLVDSLASLNQPIRVLRPGWNGDNLNKGGVTVQSIPFLPQQHYDELLWLCDLNFVRGEDSFVRAQLAGKPFIWQAYPQEQMAHLDKVRAFLDRYAGVVKVSPGATASLQAAWLKWNEGSAPDMNSVLGNWQEIVHGASQWQEYIFHQKDLATQLVCFCDGRWNA